MTGIASIVVGVDFTPCSKAALSEGLRIAKAVGAALHVVHVIDTLVVIELEEALSPMQKSIREGLTRDATHAWGGFAKSVSGAESVPIEVAINNRIVGILKRAGECRADLVILGAFGERPPDVGVGTIATACVRKSASDVLLVRDSQAGPFRSIVAAVDFSPTSQRAVERAAMMAAIDGAELHIVHVFEAPWHRLHYRAPTPAVAPHFQKQYRDLLDGQLREFCRAPLQAQPSVKPEFAVYDYSGHRSGVIEYAQSAAADLIVLGTRGRTNIRDLLLGSTAEKVLRESQCSVLAVKPPGFQHPIAGE